MFYDRLPGLGQQKKMGAVRQKNDMNSMTDDAPGDGSGPQGGKRNGLLATNDLVYILPPDLSVSVNQTHKNQFFQSARYDDTQRAVCILNTGADYGDMRHSSLEFGIEVKCDTVGAGVWFGRHGSILNVIKSITISSRSGDELSRIQDLNLLNYTQNGYRYDSQWHESVGQTIGTGTHLIPSTNAVAGIPARFHTQRFSIPLYLLSDFFGYGRLMPPMVLSGLRVEIEWAPKEQAFSVFEMLATDGAVPPIGRDALSTKLVTSYTIDKPYIAVRSVQLTDATQRSLNEMSAVNGLELVYCDYERTDRQENTGNLNMEIRKAASRALKCILTTRTTTNVSAPNLDSFASEEWDYSNWQWQLGSLYFPQQPVSSNAGDAAGGHFQIMAESYKHALIAYDKYRGTNGKCAATPLYATGNHLDSSILTSVDADFDLTTHSPYSIDGGEVGLGEDVYNNFEAGSFGSGNGIVAVTLERSDLFNLSGVPINNSRVLAIRANYITPKARTFTTFLKYVRLARVFMNNVEVEQ